MTSSLAHATWNLLLKRSKNQGAFLWLMLASASVLLLPLGATMLWLNPISQAGWWLVITTIILHVFYFLLLGQGYSQGDLSLVYPIARGMGPMLVPILAVVILGERISTQAILGIVAITMGIYVISWWGRWSAILKDPLHIMRNPGTRYAVFTGIVIAAYALVDKSGVAHVQPFLYMYLMTLGSAVGITPYILRRHGVPAVVEELRGNAVPVISAGLLTFLAYGLVLTAFSLSRVSYVAPAREVGIVIGVLMGVLFLREPFGLGRLLGSVFIVAGLILIALFP